MTREEAIAIIENEKECVNRANKNDYCNRDCYNCELVKTDTEILTALDMAIKALEQEPTDDATLKDIFCMGCEYKEQEPCETQMIDKSNFSQEQYKADLQSAYDCGKASVKPCEDAISIEEAIHCLEQLVTDMPQLKLYAQKVADAMRDLHPVYPKPKTGRWEWVQYDYNPKLGNWHCSECRSIAVKCVDKNEKGGIPLYKYCPNCGTKMVEPQESEDKE